MTDGDFKSAQILKEQIEINEKSITLIEDSYGIEFYSLGNDKKVKNTNGSFIFDNCKKLAIDYYIECNRKLDLKFQALGKIV